uniref:Amidase domain-containing protein n=1 Tax=Lactuca sativa TaxID=4236 RepID=A0A9R1X3S3_LACSA|nr:hypothetical protein LSAT_V11C700378050 [Lactuca sativa]
MSKPQLLDHYYLMISLTCLNAIIFITSEKKNDPLAMYAGDIMIVNVNLVGFPVLVLPCRFVRNGILVGVQMIGVAFDEVKIVY